MTPSHRSGRLGLPEITGRNRTKTGSGRNPALRFVRRASLPSSQLCSRMILSRLPSPPGSRLLLSSPAMTNAGAAYSHFTMSNSPSRSRGAFSASGGLRLASPTPNRGVGGAPRNVRVLGGTPVGHAITRHARRLARRLASHDAGRSPLGAPPWRFWASGPRFRLLRRPPPCKGGQLTCGSVQRAPRSQVVVPGGRLPGPPEANGYKPPAAGRHSPLRLQDVSGRRPSMSEDANVLACMRYVVNSVVGA